MNFEEKILNEERKGAMVSNYSLLVIRFITLFVFLYYKAYGMLILNVLSLFTYLISIIIVKKEKLGIYVNIIFFDFLIYSLIAAILIGNDFSFSYYLFSLIPLLFYSEYISKLRNKCKIDGNFYSVIVALFYIFEMFITKFTVPKYIFPECVVYNIHIINLLCAFCYIFIYLNRFVRVVSAMEDRLHDKAELDELTRLYNRHKTNELLNEAYNDFKDNNNIKCVSILDIDNFKQINDQYGHNCGDYVLKELANILKKSTLKNNYTVSRWGGEEFLILGDLNDSTFDELEKIRQDVENYKFIYKKQRLNITITVGVSVIKNESTIANWIDKADTNLYVGKNSTKNCVIYDN